MLFRSFPMDYVTITSWWNVTPWGSGELRYSGHYLSEDADDIIGNLLDMNGDGLPDYVYKYTGSDLNIKWNLDNARFSSDWTTTTLPWDTALKERVAGSDYDTTADLIDLNGDGLPDRVEKTNAGDLKIKWNLGNGQFSDTWDNKGQPWGWPLQNNVKYEDGNVSGYYRFIDSFVSYQRSGGDGVHWDVTGKFMDMNGDGLVDYVEKTDGGALNIWWNTGDGNFISESKTVTWSYPVVKEVGVERDVYLEGRYDFRPLAEYKVIGDFIDMNGDGLLDHVEKPDQGNLKIWLQQGAPGTYLEKITHSTGGTTTYAYQPIDRTLNPGYKVKNWVVNTVTTNDGLGDVRVTTYEFSEGKYDADKRENRGYAKVIITAPTGNYTETHYQIGRAHV